MSLINSGTPSQLLASEVGIFANTSTARLVLTDLKVCKEQIPYYQTQIEATGVERDLLKQKVNLIITQRENLLSDNAELNKQKTEFKAAYLQTNESMNKLKESTPSRFTWFGIGAITMAVAVIASFFVVK